MIKQALFYTEKLNFSIIPIDSTNKKSLVPWKKHFQNRKPTPQEIAMWWKIWPDAKIGIVTGAVSNLAVIDVDTLDGYKAIERYTQNTNPPKVNTPSGGQHLYFRYPKHGVGNNVRAVVGCDLRGDGGYVVAPPSEGYAWLDWKRLKSLTYPELPDVYLKEVSKENKIEERFDKELFLQGARNEDLFHTAICLVRGNMNLGNIFQIIKFLASNIQPPTKHNNPVTINNLVMSAWNRGRK